MPFRPPFKMNFEKGDFIFGLHEVRAEYARKYSQFSLVLDKNNISTIDRYSITEKERIIREKYEHQIPSNQKSFDKAVENHFKYKPIRLCDKFTIDYNSGNVHYSRQVTGRKCKAALSWFSQSSTGSCIHFILDKIDMESVIYKHDEKKIKKGSSYTAKELRWIYRNRQDPKVISCIQFWRDGIPVSPPWVEGEYVSLWQNYHPKFENYDIEFGEFAEILDM